ncbi:MAG: hypothetical protein ACKVOK_01865 [Flavobacteriales bacterium]
MKFSFSILCILLSNMIFAQLSALHPDSLKAWSKESEAVLHIRTDTTALENWPSFNHDLGTTYTYMPFKIVNFYKRSDTLDVSQIVILHSYLNDLKEWMSPNSEYMVFLPRQYSRGNQNWANSEVVPEPDGSFLLMREKCFTFNADNDAALKKYFRKTRLDNCVYNEDWKGVENELKALVGTCSNAAKDENTAAYKLLQELNSYHSIHRVETEKCVSHIAIYPGWITYIIRFANENGPRDYYLTASLGKVFRHGWLRYKIGLSTSQDKLFHSSFVRGYDLFEYYRTFCLSDTYQRAFYPKYDPDLNWKCELLTDSIASETSNIRVRISAINKSPRVQVLSWPVNQNSDEKSTLFQFVSEDGLLIEEETPYIYLPHDETLMPSVIKLQPGDSITSIQTINNPFSFYSDADAQHHLPLIRDTRYAVQWIYKSVIPEYIPLDTSWRIPSGKTIAAPIPLRVGEGSWESDTLLVQLMAHHFSFKTMDGDQAACDALVKIISPNGSNHFSIGQTMGIKFELPFDVQEEYYDEELRAVMTNATPGDYLRVVVQTKGPVETDAANGNKCFMIAHQENAVAIR